jgi:hypothetical protein
MGKIREIVHINLKKAGTAHLNKEARKRVQFE